MDLLYPVAVHTDCKSNRPICVGLYKVYLDLLSVLLITLTVDSEVLMKGQNKPSFSQIYHCVFLWFPHFFCIEVQVFIISGVCKVM